MNLAVSWPVLTSSSTSRIISSMPRASISARSAAPGSRASSAVAIRSSARPSSTNIAWAARPGASAGSGGKSNELTASATAPPMAPSAMRVGEKPPSAAPGSSATSRIAETADSTTSELAAAERGGCRHGEHDEHADLPGAGADDGDEQRGDGDAEHHAADELEARGRCAGRA